MSKEERNSEKDKTTLEKIAEFVKPVAERVSDDWEQMNKENSERALKNANYAPELIKTFVLKENQNGVLQKDKSPEKKDEQSDKKREFNYVKGAFEVTDQASRAIEARSAALKRHEEIQVMLGEPKTKEAKKWYNKAWEFISNVASSPMVGRGFLVYGALMVSSPAFPILAPLTIGITIALNVSDLIRDAGKMQGIDKLSKEIKELKKIDIVSSNEKRLLRNMPLETRKFLENKIKDYEKTSPLHSSQIINNKEPSKKYSVLETLKSLVSSALPMTTAYFGGLPGLAFGGLQQGAKAANAYYDRQLYDLDVQEFKLRIDSQKKQLGLNYKNGTALPQLREYVNHKEAERAALEAIVKYGKRPEDFDSLIADYKSKNKPVQTQSGFPRFMTNLGKAAFYGFHTSALASSINPLQQSFYNNSKRLTTDTHTINFNNNQETDRKKSGNTISTTDSLRSSSRTQSLDSKPRNHSPSIPDIVNTNPEIVDSLVANSNRNLSRRQTDIPKLHNNIKSSIQNNH